MADFPKPEFVLKPVNYNRNYYGIDPRVYIGGKAFIVQGFVEANVKVGNQWYINYDLTIPAEGTRYILFETATDLRTLIKSLKIISDRGLTYSVFRDSNAVHGATSVPILNLHDDVNDAGFGVTPDITVSVDPTDPTNHGTRIHFLRFPSGQGVYRGGGILEEVGFERVLKKQSKYILRFTNLENTVANVIFNTGIFLGHLSTETL